MFSGQSISSKVSNKDTRAKGSSLFIYQIVFSAIKLESSCLFADDFNLVMKNASKFLRLLPSFGAISKILHKKECSSLSVRCLAGSDLLSAELGSGQRSSTLRNGFTNVGFSATAYTFVNFV